MKKYDAVIIGAGIGGIAAGVKLVLAGYKPLILEKQNVIGGRYYAGDYKGYRLTTGAWFVNSDRGAIMQLAKDAGVESKVEIGEAPTPYWKYWIDGKYCEMPEKGGVKALISMVEEPDEAARIANILTKALRWQEPSDNMSFKEWLSAYTSNEKIFKMYDMALCDVTGVRTNAIPAGEFIRILRYIGAAGSKWVLPRGHLGPLVDALADVIKSKGGELWTKTRVKKIIVDDMVVKGVVIEKDGKEMEIESQVVINNASPQDMVKLAGEQNFDKGYLKRIQDMRASVLINIYWACDRPIVDYRGIILFPLEDPPFIAVDYALTWPDLAPEGKYTLLVGGSTVSGLEVDTNKDIEDLKNIVYKHYPVLKEHGEVLVVQVFQKTWPYVWAIPGDDVENKSPVENLYTVGDGAKPQGTVVADGVVEGAKLIVEDIKRRIKPI